MGLPAVKPEKAWKCVCGRRGHESYLYCWFITSPQKCFIIFFQHPVLKLPWPFLLGCPEAGHWHRPCKTNKRLEVHLLGDNFFSLKTMACTLLVLLAGWPIWVQQSCLPSWGPRASLGRGWACSSTPSTGAAGFWGLTGLVLMSPWIHRYQRSGSPCGCWPP